MVKERIVNVTISAYGLIVIVTIETLCRRQCSIYYTI